MVLLALSGRAASAQLVIGTSNISFGRVIRGVTHLIPFLGADAAEFWVIGTKGRNIRLTVTAPNLTRTGATLPLTVTNATCAFSRDGGVTWTAFSTGTLFHDTSIPNTGIGVVMVRVGGTVVPTVGQIRGDYNGSITLTAAYR